MRACCCLLLLASCTSADEARSPLAGDAVWASGDAEIRRFHEERGVPGMSVAVLGGSDVVFAGAYRWANQERRTPVTPETVFSIGSIESSMKRGEDTQLNAARTRHGTRPPTARRSSGGHR